MTVDNGTSNPTVNRPFAEILEAHMSRRSVMVGGLAAAAVGFFGQSGVASAAEGGQKGPNLPKPSDGALLTFTPSLNEPDPAYPGVQNPNPLISPEYEWSFMIPWGTPLFVGVPDIFPGRPASSGDATQQVGCGHDGIWYFPINGSSEHGVIAVNHEYGDSRAVLGKGVPTTAEEAAISQAIHGMSVVEVRKSGGTWLPVVPSGYNRRIDPNTPVVFDGPAAGSPLLQTPAGNAPVGTVNNCGNGYTPWGTYITCEENFNGYFGATGAWSATPEQARYGFSSGGFGYAWHQFFERWDLSNPAYENESHRYGWIVEVDPMNPGAPPVKHTALGRFKHEGFAFATGRGGRAVAYMGDDERFDYIYKFVSASNWRSMRARGKSPLSEGTLYAARFDEDGTGEWLELSTRNPALDGMSMDEILVFSRIAADRAGATPMDRPEWTSVAPNGDVYCTLTNNTRRTAAQVDAANPIAVNTYGHIIRWRDSHNHVGTTFEWDIYVLAEQDTHGDTTKAFGSPDGLWCDPDGRVFIETDGDQPVGANGPRNNQLLVGDGYTGEIRRLFSGVAGDEITGIAITPDRRTLFINTQHPGDNEQDPATTNFPVPGAGGPEIPRSATIVITRKDGGIVGS